MGVPWRRSAMLTSNRSVDDEKHTNTYTHLHTHLHTYTYTHLHTPRAHTHSEANSTGTEKVCVYTTIYSINPRDICKIILIFRARQGKILVLHVKSN